MRIEITLKRNKNTIQVSFRGGRGTKAKERGEIIQDKGRRGGGRRKGREGGMNRDGRGGIDLGGGEKHKTIAIGRRLG